MTVSDDRKLGAGTYARVIEARWAELQDRSVILSPKEWALISDWYARSIPLQIVEEALDAAAEKRADGRPPRTLAYVAPAVDEAWAVVVDGRRTGVADEIERHATRDQAEVWEECARAHADEAGLCALLTELTAACRAGRPCEELDARLDRELGRSVAPERLARVVASVERELEPFLERLSEKTLRETAAAATLDRLRRELGLPRHDRSRLRQTTS